MFQRVLSIGSSLAKVEVPTVLEVTPRARVPSEV